MRAKAGRLFSAMIKALVWKGFFFLNTQCGQVMNGRWKRGGATGEGANSGRGWRGEPLVTGAEPSTKAPHVASVSLCADGGCSLYDVRKHNSWQRIHAHAQRGAEGRREFALQKVR